MFNDLTIVNGKVKLFHYSNSYIPDNSIIPGMGQNRHSMAEYKAWGADRSFFYATKDGVFNDRGVPSSQYYYVAYMPLKEIYDVNADPNNYQDEIPSGLSDYEYFNTLRDMCLADGYTSWIYGLDGDENTPIVVAFKNVRISERYQMREHEWKKVKASRQVGKKSP